MTAKLFASGDMAADRRAEFAETLAHLGDAAGAIEVLRGALQIVPGWGAGWFRLGEYFERCGDLAEADAAWARAVQVCPDDPFGAGLRRDLLRDQPLSDRMPPAFVEMLFDQYAHRFETSLVDKLGYQGPRIIADALRKHAPVNRALDLGCGTGLMGPVLRPICRELAGVDLSQAMLDEAAEKGVYDRLDKSDIQTLSVVEGQYDLIVAADVFIYIGALERVIGWCAASLTPGGTLVFTVELGEGRDVALQPSRRFTHSRGYIADLMQSAGFTADLRDVVLRRDRGDEVRALCVTARLPARRRQGDGEAQHTADA